MLKMPTLAGAAGETVFVRIAGGEVKRGRILGVRCELVAYAAGRFAPIDPTTMTPQKPEYLILWTQRGSRSQDTEWMPASSICREAAEAHGTGALVEFTGFNVKPGDEPL